MESKVLRAPGRLPEWPAPSRLERVGAQQGWGYECRAQPGLRRRQRTGGELQRGGRGKLPKATHGRYSIRRVLSPVRAPMKRHRSPTERSGARGAKAAHSVPCCLTLPDRHAFRADKMLRNRRVLRNQADVCETN